MSDLPLIPFALTTRDNLEFLELEGLGDVDVILVDDPARRDFCLLLNHTNQLAFGGANMGMPLWVMLDCGVLSSAIIGFALPREHVSDELAETVGIPEGYDDPLVPVSEYCACPILEPRGVSGFSLQSQLTGCGVATRTKALALAMYGSRVNVGVTQFDNAAIRVHSRFGPLRVTLHRPVVHTHSHKTFAYRLELPARDVLVQMAHGTLRRAPHPEVTGERVDFDPSLEENHERLRQWIADGRRVEVVAPGWVDGILPLSVG